MTKEILLDRRDVMAAALGLDVPMFVPAYSYAQAQPKKAARRAARRHAVQPAALDPMTGRNLPDLNTLYAIFDPLIDFDPETLTPSQASLPRPGRSRIRRRWCSNSSKA